MYRALYLSPMIPSFNLADTVQFFCDCLLFKTARDDGNYFILYKDDLTIHILNAGDEIGQMEFYLQVDDVDQVWNFMKDKIKNIKVREPFDRDYGMRELHIAVPGTKTLLFVGQEIQNSK